jgi:hypothetical protein
MHEHDLDLIASYADGSLADTGEAERLVSSCARCAAEFTAQQAALAALRDLPPVSLNDLERTRLHREVLAAVGEGSPSDVRVVEFRSRGWWERVGLRAAAVAAVALVGIGLVGVLGRMAPTAQDSFAGEEMATEAAATDATMEAGSEVAELAGADTAAAAPAASPRTIDLGAVDMATLNRAIEERLTDQVDSSLAAGDGTTAAPSEDLADESAKERTLQLARCDLDPLTPLVLVAEVDGRPIAVVFDGDPNPRALWTDTCEPADLG